MLVQNKTGGEGFPAVLLWLLPALIPALLVYWQVTGFDLIWDDQVIRLNRDYYSGAGLLRRIFLEGMAIGAFYRPLPALTMALESLLLGSGHEAAVAHAINLVLMLANTLMVGQLCALNLAGASRRVRLSGSLVSMLLFSLHPALLSCFVFVSTRFDVMMTFFILLGLLLQGQLAEGRIKALLVGLCFLCAMLSKEYALVAIPVMLVYSLHRELSGQVALRRVLEKRDLAFRLLPVIMPVILYLALRAVVGNTATKTMHYFPLFEPDALLRTIKSIGVIVQLLLLPHAAMLPAFSRSVQGGLSDPLIALGCVALAVFVALLLARRLKPLHGLLVFLWFAPYINLLFTPSDYSLLWPWYLLLWLALGCVYGVPRVCETLFAGGHSMKQWLCLAVLAAWTATAVYVDITRVKHWQSETAFFGWWQQVDPASDFAAENYLVARFVQPGSDADKYADAMGLIARHPASAKLHWLAGMEAVRQGQIDAADALALHGIERVVDKGQYANLLALAANIQLYRHDAAAALPLLVESDKIAPGDWYLGYVKLRYFVETKNGASAQASLRVLDQALGTDPALRARKMAMYAVDEAEIETLRASVRDLDAAK